MGFVYLIKCPSSPACYKVGKADSADHVAERLKSCQTGNPYKLKLITLACVERPFSVETTIRNVLKDAGLHMRGDWFSSVLGLEGYMSSGDFDWVDQWVSNAPSFKSRSALRALTWRERQHSFQADIDKSRLIAALDLPYE